MTTQTTPQTRTEQLDALLARLSGKVTNPTTVIGELCRIHRDVPAKWDRFVASALTNMPSLTADDLAAIIAYVSE
jgi:hypothetical protein